jgi:nitric oxide reductase subunit C
MIYKNIFSNMAIGIVSVLFFGITGFAQEGGAQVGAGKKIYNEMKCPMCHKIDGVGGKIGPDLSGVGSRKDAQWIKGFLKDPKSIIPDTKQPPFKGTDEELEAVVTYLMSLK